MTAQSEFTAALLDPSRPVPAALVDPQGRPAGKRFAVYRNNVTVSLIDALETAFPVVRKLLGDDFFRALAREFLRAHPPESPLLMFYGRAMPDFLAGFPPTQQWGYLPDVARLELAIRHAYHAADVPSLPPQALAMAPERLLAARFALAPAVSVVASPWPVHAIWRINMDPDAPKPVMQAQEVLVGRPALDPGLWVLPAAGGAFVGALAAGLTMAQALDAAGDGFDLTPALQALIAAGALTRLLEGTEDAGTDRAS